MFNVVCFPCQVILVALRWIAATTKFNGNVGNPAEEKRNINHYLLIPLCAEYLMNSFFNSSSSSLPQKLYEPNHGKNDLRNKMTYLVCFYRHSRILEFWKRVDSFAISGKNVILEFRNDVLRLCLLVYLLFTKLKVSVGWSGKSVRLYQMNNYSLFRLWNSTRIRKVVRHKDIWPSTSEFGPVVIRLWKSVVIKLNTDE